MKTLIATAVGGLALGGLVTAQAMRSPSVETSRTFKTIDTRSIALDGTTGPVFLNCGAGRQALVRQATGEGAQIDCFDVAGIPVAQAYAQPVTMNGFTAGPVLASQTYPVAPRTVVQDRVVYRDEPVYRPTARRTTTTRSAPAYRTASTTRTADEYRQPQGRTWKKSALIIGGSAAGGAGVGAILDGKSGAKKGAVLGGVGGLVYDLATRNKDRR